MLVELYFTWRRESAYFGRRDSRVVAPKTVSLLRMCRGAMQGLTKFHSIRKIPKEAPRPSARSLARAGCDHPWFLVASPIALGLVDSQRELPLQAGTHSHEKSKSAVFSLPCVGVIGSYRSFLSKRKICQTKNIKQLKSTDNNSMTPTFQ